MLFLMFDSSEFDGLREYDYFERIMLQSSLLFRIGSLFSQPRLNQIIPSNDSILSKGILFAVEVGQLTIHISLTKAYINHNDLHTDIFIEISHCFNDDLLLKGKNKETATETITCL